MWVASGEPAEGVGVGSGKFWVQPDHSAQTFALWRTEVSILVGKDTGRAFSGLQTLFPCSYQAEKNDRKHLVHWFPSDCVSESLRITSPSQFY